MTVLRSVWIDYLVYWYRRSSNEKAVTVTACGKRLQNTRTVPDARREALQHATIHEKL